MSQNDKPKAQSNEIRLTREYDAPVETVWAAWTDPVQAAQWWGPRGFTLTTHSKDLRPGGIWHYTMHGPDGVDYPNKAHYYEVEECRKLVYDHGGYDDRPPLFQVTVLFSEQNGKTLMEMTMAFPSPEEAAATIIFIKKAGGNGTWDRLAEYLADQNGRSCFVLNRTFNAPQQQVFEMWVNPDHFAKWLPPAGFAMKYLRTHIEPGGSIFYKMSNASGMTMYSRFDYLEIERSCRIVFSQSFCDEYEQPGHHPGLPVWPDSILATVIFSVESPTTTRVTMSSEPCPGATVEEIAAFLNLKPSMSQGWNGSFDTLELLMSSDRN